MAPSIAKSNSGDLEVAGSTTHAAPAKENHEQNPTVESGNPLMWSEGSEPVSSSPLYIVTSDYDSADDSAEPSPSSRPPSEAGFSVCSSSADVPPEEYPIPFGLVPALGGFPPHFQFGLQGDNTTFLMYPPPVGMVYNVPQGLPMPLMPQQGAPLQMQMPHTAAQMMSPGASPGPVTSVDHIQHQPQEMMFSPPPPMMSPQGNMAMVPAPHQIPTPGFQSPPYSTPPPTVSPMGPPAIPEGRTTTALVATMPMPKLAADATEGDENLSVGTRNGPMVLFATAPGASEMAITVPGMSGYPDSVSQQMEIVWNGEFARNFSSLERTHQHHWVLKPSDTVPKEQGKWNVFKDSAKVRFMCHNCGNAWTSMKGRVMFWISLDRTENLGGVLFKLYGQACDKCASNDDEPTFCPAMWYPEEVVKVVGNLFNRVGQLFYGFEAPGLRIDRRQGRPREHHNAKRCQACQEGVCRFEWVFS